MNGSITIQIQDTGDWTLAELKDKIEDYVVSLTNTNKFQTNNEFFGILNLADDPMKIQEEMRSEW